MVQRADLPLVLGFDTSGPHCAAALLRGDQILAQQFEERARGQAERLMPMLEEILDNAKVSWGDLDALGVGIGPGNFTGIRIAVSAARGLALGLDIPCVGISGFDARAQAGHVAAVPAPRDQVYAQFPKEAPRLMPLPEAEAAARSAGLALAPVASPKNLAARIAELAGQRYQDNPEPPAPLYLRPADAAPARDLPPQLLDD